MDEHRKLWNHQQKRLQLQLLDEDPPTDTFELFFEQHAAMHSSQMSGEDGWSLEDQILNDLNDITFRSTTSHQERSIAWLIWHIARIEDVAMGMLVGGGFQLFDEGDWAKGLGVNYLHTGNAMSADEIIDFSNIINFEALRAYRVEVGRRTRSIIGRLSFEELSKKVDPKRLQTVLDVGAVVEAALGVIEYWSKRTIAELLLMPATRHNLIHLNEAERIKSRQSRQSQ